MSTYMVTYGTYLRTQSVPTKVGKQGYRTFIQSKVGIATVFTPTDPRVEFARCIFSDKTIL
jgi:hypothetical protein